MMNLSRVPKRLFGKVSKILKCSGDVTIITGANAPFYESLVNNLLSSILRYEPNANLIIWNLGLSSVQIAEIQHFTKNHRGGVKILDYQENKLPEHFSLAKFNYAFKSYIVFQSLPLIETRYAMWLDAGCGLQGPLDAERNIINLYGYYCPYSSTSTGVLTHEGVMSNFYSSDKSVANKQMLSSGVQGWDMDDYHALFLLSEWYNLTRLEDHISPEGASLKNHRYDQSLLTLLYYAHNNEVPYLCRYLYNVLIQLNKK